MAALPRVSDQAGKVALGVVALVEVPQIMAQWLPSIWTIRGGDWPGKRSSVYAGLVVGGIQAIAVAALISWIIGENWPLIGGVIMVGVDSLIYSEALKRPARGQED